MKLLAIETTSIACSVALQVNGKTTARHVVEAKVHTRILLPMINELLADAGVNIPDLDALVLGNGPGSFIGMRIGASVAQGLAFAAGLNIVPVSSLAAVAVEVFSTCDTDRVAVAQDARMNEVYLGCFERADNGLPIDCMDERIHPVASIDALTGSNAVWEAAGEGWQRYPGLMKSNEEFLTYNCKVTLPRATALLDMALASLDAGGDIAPEQLQPAYLRDQVATPPGNQS